MAKSEMGQRSAPFSARFGFGPTPNTCHEFNRTVPSLFSMFRDFISPRDSDHFPQILIFEIVFSGGTTPVKCQSRCPPQWGHLDLDRARVAAAAAAAALSG